MDVMNVLPWRQQKKQYEKKICATLFLFTTFISLVILISVDVYINHMNTLFTLKTAEKNDQLTINNQGIQTDLIHHQITVMIAEENHLLSLLKTFLRNDPDVCLTNLKQDKNSVVAEGSVFDLSALVFLQSQGWLLTHAIHKNDQYVVRLVDEKMGTSS